MKTKGAKIGLAAVLVAVAVVLLFLLLPKEYTAVFEGVTDLSLPRSEVLSGKDVYVFEVDGTDRTFSIDDGTIFAKGYEADSDGDGVDDYYGVLDRESGGYPIENELMEGRTYEIRVRNDKILDAKQTDGSITDTAEAVGPISGTPGVRTLKNMLEMACAPMGSTLYVWGGGWDFQDIGWSDTVRTAGVPASWKQFYDSVDADYAYAEHQGNEWNAYYYAGADCSGYMSWLMYNVFNSESLAAPSISSGASGFAKKMAEEYSFGTWTHHSGNTQLDETWYKSIVSELRPGSIVSIDGHVYMIVGVCDDLSLVVIHSSASSSVSDARGGGVQLSAISIKGDEDYDCQAYKLADDFMKTYYPDWNSRYPTILKSTSTYLGFEAESERTGVFNWEFSDAGISDPDGIAEMSAGEVFESLLGN